ncbi:hypothetical protein VNI00_011686 [Paramarasmius palmivorus]|uniref:Uncharacterized protein n=1 Tax=Paramarasmius palmivorus TaxID=297713 RepID=A0AAW0CEP7_9AGAR
MFSGLTVFVLAGTLFAAVRGLVVPDTSVHQLTKRVVYQCQDPAQLDIATNAYNEGKVMAAAARDYINSHGVSDPLVVQYFGNDTSLIPRVSLIYNQIANEAGANYTINCAPSGGCGDRTVARNIRFTNFCTQGGVTRECGWSSRTEYVVVARLTQSRANADPDS